MKKTKLTLVPLSGLCNRMRAMASGVYLAKELGIPISVYWRKNKDCFAAFTDLFKPVSINQVDVKSLTWSKFYLLPDGKRNFYLPGRIRNVIFDKQITGAAETFDHRVLKQIGAGKTYLLSAYSLAKHYPLNELFKPVSEIQNQINGLKKSFSQDVIGIHIRRSDNKHSIAKNKIEDYFRFMDLEIESSQDTKFYLATDAIEVKQEMIRRYKDKIIYHPATLERTSVQGMKDAVTDLWCLSLTKRIIGSYYSSYSDLAAELGGIELIIL
jgi:Alpha-(1,6)-fucosyltransferase N- and catalytic domains